MSKLKGRSEDYKKVMAYYINMKDKHKMLMVLKETVKAERLDEERR